MNDPYVYSNGVLKNKLNIKNHDELKQAEADIGFLKLINVEFIEAETFDEELLKKLHKHIFGDIFEWAGEFRKCPLVKEEFIFPGYSVPYSYHKDIPKDLKQKIKELNQTPWSDMSKEEIASVFARKIALLWKVHPFRDGNTRTILSFSYLYAKEHGFPMDMETFTNNIARLYYENGKVSRHSIRDKFVIASLEEENYPEVAPLASVFEQAMKKYSEKNPEENIHIGK